jgi:hypothetical protein
MEWMAGAGLRPATSQAGFTDQNENTKRSRDYEENTPPKQTGVHPD